MHKNSGFSLLELLTVIGILAILSSIAMPALVQWRQKAQLGSATRDLYSNFQKAKMEAARNNSGCTMAFNQGSCDYVVFMDADNDQVWDGPPTENPISCVQWSDFPGVSLSSLESFPSNGTNAYIILAEDGLVKYKNGSLAEGKVHLQSGDKNTIVTVSMAGSIWIEQYAK